MAPEKRDFLINEYSNLNNLLLNVTTIAYTVLSGGVVVFGTLLANVKSGGDQDPYAYMLALVPTILSLILGQLTHAGYFIYFRMLRIAKEFEITDDLWHRWEKYISKAINKPRFLPFGVTQYAGSFPMVLVLYIGIIIGPIYVFWTLRAAPAFWFCLVMSLINLWLTYTRLDPLSFYQRVADDLGFFHSE